MSYKIAEMTNYKEDWCSGYCLKLGKAKQPLWFSFENLMRGYEKPRDTVDQDYGLDVLEAYYQGGGELRGSGQLGIV